MNTFDTLLQEHGDTSLSHVEIVHDESALLKEFLEHHGIKGMRWGFRKENSSSGAPTTSKEEIRAHNATTDRLVKSIKSATREDEVNGILDKAYDDGLVEGNIKIASAYPRNDGKTVTYELKAYRMTEGKPNEHADNGVKVEWVIKDVARDPRPGKSVADLVEHSEELDAFLEHHGIKGQRWGIRRTDDQLGRVASLKAKFSRNKVEKADSKKSGGGESDSKSDDTPSTKSGGGSDHIAIDHERLVDSLGKTVDQMSTQEIQQAANRAQAIQNYQRMFAPENKSALEKQVAQLNLEKQRRDLEAQLNPPQKSAISKLIERSQQGYNGYLAVDKALGGDLSKALSRKLGTAPPPSLSEQAKLRTEMAKASKAEADARAAISTSSRTVQTNHIFKAEESVLKMDILRGDLPSQAAGYSAAGKRRAVGDFTTGKNNIPVFKPTSHDVDGVKTASGSHILRGTTRKNPLFVGDEGTEAGAKRTWDSLGFKISPEGAFVKNPNFNPTKPASQSYSSPSHRKDNPLDAFLLKLGQADSSPKIPTSFPKPGKHR